MLAVRRAVSQTVSGLPQEFWWLWTSTLTNRIGGFVVPFLALYLTVDRGFSAAYAGLVAALYGLGGIVGALLGGVLSDRIGRRKTMLVTQAGAATATATLGFVTAPVPISALVCVVGVTTNAARPVVQAMMADLVPAEDQGRAFSLNYWATNFGMSVSTALAGLMATHGYLALFLTNALMTLLCGMVVFIKIPETRPSMPDGDAAVTPAEAIVLSRVLRDGRFMALVGSTFLIATLVQQSSNTLAVSMGNSGLTASQYGLVAGLNGLLIVLLQIPITRLTRSCDRAWLLLVSSLLVGGGFGLTIFAESAWSYAVTVTVWTLGEVVMLPASVALVADFSPTHARGRYQGMYALAWSAASFVGPLAGGVALDRWGNGMWPFCAVIGAVAGAGYWALLRTRSTGLSAKQVDTAHLQRHSSGDVTARTTPKE
ncbi:MDR family MFS transporter [Streptomyces kanamyceticus]|uniref:MDR family MFS transporter n=1 Tax=Streptomyces kanamyceticus TaxID=1967 RepID=UPI0037DC7C80